MRCDARAAPDGEGEARAGFEASPLRTTYIDPQEETRLRSISRPTTNLLQIAICVIGYAPTDHHINIPRTVVSTVRYGIPTPGMEHRASF